MTLKQKQALAWLRAARQDDPYTDDGVLYAGETFYDVEIKVAYVNFHTAEALARRGLVTIGVWDPDAGTAVTLTDVAAPQSGADT